MRQPIYFNGKFYAGDFNGVHRVADRLVREVDRLAGARWGNRSWDLRLLIPRRRKFSPDVSTFRIQEQRSGHTQRWEQGILPFVARNGLLVNLANLSPILHPSKVTLLHDAQYYLSPETYAFHFSVGYRILTPIMARSSVSVLTISEYSREMLGAFGISSWKNTKILYNGVDHILESPADRTILERHHLAKGRYAVLFGSTHIYKNVGTVFSAFSHHPIDGVRLVVVGQSREKLAAGGLSPPANAVFVGKINDSELRALYESALCLLYPSRTEGFGLPPLEAMLCGCPAIVAPAGAIPEICRDAVLYADVADPAGWTERINALTANPELRAHKVAQGHARAAHFTWEKSGIRIMNVLEELSGRSQ